MRVTGTPAAAAVVARVRERRRGALVFTIGTGCCESTAPFLYEDFWPGPDQEQVGEVGGVAVFAPEYLRRLYANDDGVVVDVDEDRMAESLSIETELGARFVLRDRAGGDVAGQGTAVCAPTGEPVAAEVSALRSRGPQPLPEALRNVRAR